MRKPVRRLLGVALIGLVSAFVLAPTLAGAETDPGEGTTPPPPPGSCSWTAPTTVGAIGQAVTINVTAPGGVTVQLFINGAATPSQQVTLPATPNPGTTTFAPTVTTNPWTFTIGYLYGNKNAYTGSCSAVAGESVGRVAVAGDPVARALAFTGSSETPTYVIVGAAAVILGLVFVVGARRRARTNA